MSKTDKELNDLEARLRERWSPEFPIPNSMLEEAADAIAELRKKNAGLVGALEEIRDELLPLSREAPERALAQIGVVANRAAKGLPPALKENTQ